MSEHQPPDDVVDRFVRDLATRDVPPDLASAVVTSVRADNRRQRPRWTTPLAVTASVVVVLLGTLVANGFLPDITQRPGPSVVPLVSMEPPASAAPVSDAFEFAQIAAEGVEIRTEPAGGTVITSTSGDLGDLVLVLGRRIIDGVEWARVEHSSPRGSARFGWMPSIADLQTPTGVKRLVTLEPAVPGCENPATRELSLISRHPPPVRLACSGRLEVMLSPVIGRAEGAEEPASGEPAWLATASGIRLYGARGWDSDDIPLDIHLDPSRGLAFPTEVWLEVTGHFDDPASVTCNRTSGHPEFTVGDPPEQVLWCRQQFVVTGFREVATPPPEPTPAPAGTIAGGWEAIADAPIQGRTGHTAVWTGTEMIVWGGEPGPATTDDTRTSDGSDGAAYNPATDRWRTVSPAPITGRTGHVAAWTGEELLVWGGWRTFGQERLADGAAYDPENDMWRPLPAAPMSGAGGTVAAWTGREWIVIDGITDESGPITAQVAAYDPQANAWTSLPELEMPASHSAVASWTGQDLVVVANPNQGRSAAYALHPGEEWIGLPEPPFDGLNTGAAGVWTGTELLVPTTGAPVAGEDRVWDQVFGYDPVLERWRSAALPPGGIRTLEPIWTGTFAVFFSGAAPADAYDPTRDLWFTLPPTGDRTREFASGIWAGDRFIAWGGGEGELFLRRPDGIAFVPGARFVDAAVHGGQFPVRVEVADASGGLVGARTATEEEMARDPAGWNGSDVQVAQGDDVRSLLVRWVGGPGDQDARLEIAADRAAIDLVAVPTYGDAIPVQRGVVLIFRDTIDPADVTIRLWAHRL